MSAPELGALGAGAAEVGALGAGGPDVGAAGCGATGGAGFAFGSAAGSAAGPVVDPTAGSVVSPVAGCAGVAPKRSRNGESMSVAWGGVPLPAGRALAGRRRPPITPLASPARWKTAIAPWPGLVTSSPSMTVSSSTGSGEP